MYSLERYFVLFLLSSSLQSVVAQSKVDVLKDKLRNATDSNEVQVLNELSFEIRRTDIESSERFALEALKLSETLAYLPGKARALKNLGIVARYEGRYDEALDFYGQSLKINQALGNQIEISANLNNTGNVFNYRGDYAKALTNFKEALSIIEEVGDTARRIVLLQNIGQVYESLGNYPKSLGNYQKCLELAIRKKIPTEVADSYLDISRIYLTLNEPRQAQKLAEQALAMNRTLKNKIGEVDALKQLSRLYVANGNNAKALDLITVAINLNRKIGQKSQNPQLLMTLAMVHENLGQYQKAEAAYLKSLTQSRELQDLSGEANSRLAIGRLFRKTNQLLEAEQQLTFGLSVADKISEQLLERNLAMELSQVYVALNKYQLALNYYERFTELSDSLFSLNKSQQLAEVQNSHEIEQQKKQNLLLISEAKLQSAQLSQQKLEKGILTFLLASLFFTGCVLVFGFWQKRRDNQELRSTNEQVSFQKEKLENTLRELKETKSQLIQSEKMAALGQITTGVAHEVNTPLGAINASASNIESSVADIFKELPQLIKSLDRDSLKLFFELILWIGQTELQEMPALQRRRNRRKLREQLDEMGVKNSELLADTMSELQLYEDYEKWSLLHQHPNNVLIFETARKLSSIKAGNELVKTAVQKASKILFALKKFSHRDYQGEKRDVDLQDSIETVLTIYENYLSNGITLVKNYEKVPRLKLFADQITQVWTNLLHNALQAMNFAGELEITIKNDEHGVEVIITDSGHGIPIAIQEKVFDPFFTTRPKGEGTGLGLDVVRRIVEKHEGKIDFKTEVNVGTSFRVYLPLTNQDYLKEPTFSDHEVMTE